MATVAPGLRMGDDGLFVVATDVPGRHVGRDAERSSIPTPRPAQHADLAASGPIEIRRSFEDLHQALDGGAAAEAAKQLHSHSMLTMQGL